MKISSHEYNRLNKKLVLLNKSNIGITFLTKYNYLISWNNRNS
jgi:hypothetical protein